MSKNLSIILCTYNEAKVISNTIDEIFLHNPNAEIIIVDDNSTDGTQKIIKEKKLNHINLIARKSRGLQALV